MINKYLPGVPGSFFSHRRPVAGFPGIRQGIQIEG
jgi:hypothetical protein